MKNFICDDLKETFYTEMAIDAVENKDNGYTKSQQYGFVDKYVTNVKTEQIAREIGKPRGVYVTIDVRKKCLNENEKSTLIKIVGNAIKDMSIYSGGIKKNILVVGLGNGGLVADSLGPEVANRVKVTRNIIKEGTGDRFLKSLASVAPSVYGKTGIESFDVVKGIVTQIKPDLVIAVDTLCTSKVGRIGNSFQLSTAGIEPASGVNGGRTGLNYSTLKVPTLAIGVPLVAKLDKVLYNAFSNYDSKRGSSTDAAKYAETLIENNLSGLIVTPKEIDFLTENTAQIIASAINFAAFG
ncbi:MAG: GPR endopeptidase [Christensenellales bacterium]